MPHIHFCGARVFFYCAGGSLWLYLKFWALDFDKRESFLISLKDETERRSNSRRIKSEASKWARQHFRCTSGLFNNFSHTDGYCICNSFSRRKEREKTKTLDFSSSWRIFPHLYRTTQSVLSFKKPKLSFCICSSFLDSFDWLLCGPLFNSVFSDHVFIHTYCRFLVLIGRPKRMRDGLKMT